MTEKSHRRTLECSGCGSETYNLCWTYDGDLWAECSECGRPTSAVGDGRGAQKRWEAENA